MERLEAIELAGRHAAVGHAVFPVAISQGDGGKLAKRPLTRHGHKDATTDAAAIEAMFDGARLRDGETFGVGRRPALVLDCDIRADVDGHDTLAALTHEHGRLPDHPIYTTPSGGSHHDFALPPDTHVSQGSAERLGDGIDVRTQDGWVVAAGTVTPWGSWLRDDATSGLQPPIAPAWLVDLLSDGRPGGQAAHWQPLDRTQLRPGDERALAALEALGGHSPYLGSDGWVRVTRPGKPDGSSASIGYLGAGVVKVFTSNWSPLEADGVYDADHLVLLAQKAQRPTTGSMSLESCHGVFRRWLGEAYDIDALNAVLATAAAERFEGDPLWLLIISGSGNAKTELVQSLRGIGASVVSTVSSEGALLSGTPKRDKARNSTGGLLREIGDRGLLVIKDMTSILSMAPNLRAVVLAALREIHDGHWTRYLGTDGGRTLSWEGRLTIVGAVTTAWDQHHSVVASMGDRFLVIRTDSTRHRVDAGRQAIANTGHEVQMRAELSEAVAATLAEVRDPGEVTEAESARLLAAADLVTKARTAVVFDYRGDVVDAHAPEMPTRFAKQLAQLVRGGVAVGMSRLDAMALAIRCARESVPPLRLLVIEAIARRPGSSVSEIRREVNKPRSTVDRQCQALHILEVVEVSEEPRPQGGIIWRHRLNAEIDPGSIHVPGLIDETPISTERETESVCVPTKAPGVWTERVERDPYDFEMVDKDLYGPDGAPRCRFVGGLGCVNGNRCLNPNHRGPRLDWVNRG